MTEMDPNENLIYFPWKRITIRQTPDPYVADREYIAYGEVSLEPNGDLLYEELSKLGLGEPGEKFWLIHYRFFWLLTDRLDTGFIEDCIDEDLGLGPVVTVCGYQDHLRAKKRRIDRFYAEEHAKEMARLAELMARLQRVPAIRAWNYVTSSISRAVSNLKPQSKLSKITYLLTSWQRRRVGDYGYFEAIDIMEEEKEYWEAFHKSWQGA